MINTDLYNELESRGVVQSSSNYCVIEYKKDLSVWPENAMAMYYAAQMGIRQRQLVVDLNNTACVIQSGAMQMMLGNIEAATDVKGAGDFMKKLVSSKVTGESAIKPKYSGVGQLVLEPTYKHILLENLDNWGGSLVIDDGLFLACDANVKIGVTARSNLSSAVLGGEGLFNTCLQGTGMVALESPCARDELITIDLQNDTVKIDGNMAIAWSNTLQFTVEKTTKTLIGSAASGEGFVNVYRGTGRILVAPVGAIQAYSKSATAAQTGSSSSGGKFVGSMIGGMLSN